MVEPQDFEKLEIIAKSDNAPKLTLRIKNGTQKTIPLEISPLGLIGSNRDEFDGFVYFGTKKKSLPDQWTGRKTILNDFVIKNTD